jgi:hypothetical protein
MVHYFFLEPNFPMSALRKAASAKINRARDVLLDKKLGIAEPS